jgi:hypothetical protein
MMKPPNSDAARWKLVTSSSPSWRGWTTEDDRLPADRIYLIVPAVKARTRIQRRISFLLKKGLKGLRRGMRTRSEGSDQTWEVRR